MKALFRMGDEPKAFELKDIEEPVIEAGKVKIKVAFSGICGTDVHMYHGAIPLGEPALLGHEFSGTIAELGEGVEGFAVGQEVTVEHTYEVCGSCINCRQGKYQLCEQRLSVGFEKPGAFAEYLLVSPEYIHVLPANVSLREGSMTEPLACAVHGVELVNPQAGTRCLVVGPGPIGILVGATLKAYGCQVDIVGTPADKERLEVAKVYGLKILSLEDLEKQQDYDLVADCSGAAGGINTALKSVRKGGDFLQVGIAGKPVSIDYDTVLFKELKIQGTFCHNYPTWERALTLESEGLIDVKPLLSDDRTIDQWEESFEDLSNQKAMKILFKF